MHGLSPIFSWDALHYAGNNFLSTLRETMQGTMYNVLQSSFDYNLAREGDFRLRNYLEECVRE